MIRKYGSEPFKIVVVHGGPGAQGSVAGLARELSLQYGVIEPMQTKYTISELIDELYEQIKANCQEPVILIGHSWGAWLVTLFAEQYPDLVSKLILIGSGPLESKYVSEISERRKMNMTDEQRKEYDELITLLESDGTVDKNVLIKRLGEIVDKADYYDQMLLAHEDQDTLPADGEAYSKIWPEAAKLRETGKLLKSFENISCPIIIIQGDTDPHPFNGLVIPLLERNIKFAAYSIDKCGHTPWKEKYGYKEFFKIINKEIKTQGYILDQISHKIP